MIQTLNISLKNNSLFCIIVHNDLLFFLYVNHCIFFAVEKKGIQFDLLHVNYFSSGWNTLFYWLKKLISYKKNEHLVLFFFTFKWLFSNYMIINIYHITIQYIYIYICIEIHENFPHSFLHWDKIDVFNEGLPAWCSDWQKLMDGVTWPWKFGSF